MATTFATEMREGFHLVNEVFAERELELLSRARDSLNESVKGRNQILARVVRAYQHGPRQLWAPVLLDLLAPALIDCLQTLRPEPPVLDEEEIRQQLVMEVLRAARRMPIHQGGRQMRIRLVTRANKSVVRWLRREGIRQRWQSSIEALGEDGRQ